MNLMYTNDDIFGMINRNVYDPEIKIIIVDFLTGTNQHPILSGFFDLIFNFTSGLYIQELFWDGDGNQGQFQLEVSLFSNWEDEVSFYWESENLELFSEEVRYQMEKHYGLCNSTEVAYYELTRLVYDLIGKVFYEQWVSKQQAYGMCNIGYYKDQAMVFYNIQQT